jgi:hypothetical protein
MQATTSRWHSMIICWCSFRPYLWKGWCEDKLTILKQTVRMKMSRGLYRGINELKNCYQHCTSFVEGENDDLLADSHSNCFCQLLIVRGVNDVRQTEIWNTVYCYGVVSYKASHALWPFSDLLCIPIQVLIILVSSTTALWQILAETSSSEAGKTW